jgi:hypothetical protein
VDSSIVHDASAVTNVTVGSLVLGIHGSRTTKLVGFEVIDVVEYRVQQKSAPGTS